MSALSIQPTYPIFTDIDGQPLEDGYVWIGAANLDPQTNPINVYWDAALTLPAAQPIRTLAGYPANSGTPARLYVNSDYSIRVMNKNGSVVYSAPAATERYSDAVISNVNASKVIYNPAGTGAVTRTVQAKLRESVSVDDFGANRTGSTDASAAFAAAVAAVGDFGEVLLPTGGIYRLSASVVTRPGITFRGYGAKIIVDSGVEAFTIAADGYPGRVSFFGIRFQGTSKTGRAISLNNNSGFARVSDCIFEGFDCALYLEGSYTSLIERCRFTGNKYGTILARAVATTKVSSCFYDYNDEVGLAINGTPDTSLHSNQYLTSNIRIESTALQNSKYGLWAEFVEDLELQSLYLEGNTINDMALGAPAVSGTNRFVRGVVGEGFYINSAALPSINLRRASRVRLDKVCILDGTTTAGPRITVDSQCLDVFVGVDQCNFAAISNTWPIDSTAAPNEVVKKIVGTTYIPTNWSRTKYGAPGDAGMQLQRRTTPGVGRPALSLESVGTDHDIMAKYTGAMRFYNASDTEVAALSHVAQQFYLTYPMRIPAVAVAALPSAVAQGPGARAFVNDANSTTWNAVVAGGGTNVVPVFSDGTNWRIG